MIIWFSGTGNSRIVAERLSRALDGEPLMRIDAHFAERIGDVGAQQRVIWVCPVYGWRVPPVVERALRAMPDSVGGSAEHWLVTTCGDDIGETPRFWQQLLDERGWRRASVYSVQMPNTYVFLPGFDVDSPEARDSKLAGAPGRVDSIARAIRAGETDVDWYRPGVFPAVKSRVLCPVFRKRLMRVEGFRVDPKRCVGCGACVQACPMENISLNRESKTPQWGHDCAFCTACYQVCSHGAISHGPFSRGKGRYVAPKSL